MGIDARYYKIQAQPDEIDCALNSKRVSGQRFTFIALQEPILPVGIALADNQSMDRITSQMVMIIEIFVAQNQAMNPLTDKLLNAVFDKTLVTVVDKTAGKISLKSAEIVLDFDATDDPVHGRQ